MSFLGPGVKLKAWKQRWWWRERRPSIVAVLLLVVGIGLAVWIPLYLDGRDENSDARPSSTTGGETAAPTPSGTAPRGVTGTTRCDD
jgi:hypothetical protein